MNKRGAISQEIGFWMPRLVFLIIAAILVATVVSYFVVEEASVLQTDAEIFTQRVLYSTNGISYVDPLTSRVYPGVIDLAKFNSIKNLEDSVFYGEKSTYLGAKFVLLDMNKKLISSQVHRNNAYRRIAEQGISGKGGVEVFEKDLYVLINDKGEEKRGFLKIIVVMSRS